MKVAMLGWEFPPFMAGGLGIHCLELTRGLVDHGVSIDFYMPLMPASLSEGRVADHHHHLRIVEIPAQSGLSPYGGGEPYQRDFNEAVSRYNDRLIEGFDSFDADVLHAHDWITIPAALEIRRRTGIPLVLTMHSLEHDRCAGFYPQAWIQRIEEAGVMQADQVIAVSRYTRSLIESEYGADGSKIVAVHNGIDASRFHSGALRDVSTASDQVLFLSRLSRQKGPLHFLQAARLVLHERPQARFTMVGTGDQLGQCIQYAADQNMLDRVTFTGFVSDDSLADMYADHGVYVLPSISEPFGISVLEAMTSGLPTIVSRTCGVGEALHHVLRFDSTDTAALAEMVVALLDHPALRQELGRNGAREANGFTWARCAARTIAVYHGLMAAEGRPETCTRTPLKDPDHALGHQIAALEVVS